MNFLRKHIVGEMEPPHRNKVAAKLFKLGAANWQQSIVKIIFSHGGSQVVDKFLEQDGCSSSILVTDGAGNEIKWIVYDQMVSEVGLI